MSTQRSVTVVALVGLLFACAEAALARTVTDSAGRQVEVPDVVSHVHAAGPPAIVLLYALAPQKMIGWLRAPSEAQKRFLLPAVRSLPGIGRLTRQTDVQNLPAAKPDLIVDFGTINNNYRGLADLVQRDTGIPYLLIDGRFENIPPALRLLGDVLGDEARGEDLARAAESIYAQVDHVLAEVSQAKRPRVYTAGGRDGLSSGGDGSFSAEIIERVGGINVASEPRTKGGSPSAEQVAAWAPDTIITLNRAFRDSVAQKPEWRAVPAVTAGRVFLAPSLPFGFIHEPPSINRLIGLSWLLHVLYPGKISGALREQVRAFYHQFYQVDPIDADMDELLDGADN